jgi:hypothetical protein
VSSFAVLALVLAVIASVLFWAVVLLLELAPV